MSTHGEFYIGDQLETFRLTEGTLPDLLLAPDSPTYASSNVIEELSAVLDSKTEDSFCQIVRTGSFVRPDVSFEPKPIAHQCLPLPPYRQILPPNPLCVPLLQLAQIQQALSGTGSGVQYEPGVYLSPSVFLPSAVFCQTDCDVKCANELAPVLSGLNQVVERAMSQFPESPLAGDSPSIGSALDTFLTIIPVASAALHRSRKAHDLQADARYQQQVALMLRNPVNVSLPTFFNDLYRLLATLLRFSYPLFMRDPDPTILSSLTTWADFLADLSRVLLSEIVKPLAIRFLERRRQLFSRRLANG